MPQQFDRDLSMLSGGVLEYDASTRTLAFHTRTQVPGRRWSAVVTVPELRNWMQALLLERTTGPLEGEPLQSAVDALVEHLEAEDRAGRDPFSRWRGTWRATG